MIDEIKHIIENRKFKRTWDDHFIYIQFVAPILIVVFGLSYLYNGQTTKEYILGTALILCSIPLTKFLLTRLRQLNAFEELENKRTKEENFDYCIAKLKTLNITTIDRDLHNLTISAKHRSNLIPPLYEWLTIVCLDGRILVNSRPAPAIILLWFRRNAMIELHSAFNNVIE